MRLIFLLVIVSLLAFSCNSKIEIKDSVPVVRVGSKILSLAELEENMPTGLSSQDSIIAAEHYIRNWINDNLLYEIASKNIRDKENIELLVERYKKSLIIYQYQEQLVTEKLSNEIDNQALQNYYNENKDKFKLDRPLVKGLFLKIPIDAPQIDKIRTWYKSITPSSIEDIQKYSIQNAVIYDNFLDQWVDFNELLINLPERYENQETVVKYNKYIEQSDSSYYYFINIKDYLLLGDNAPYEYAKPAIQEILINQRKNEFLKKTESDLYQRALSRGEIKFFTE